MPDPSPVVPNVGRMGRPGFWRGFAPDLHVAEEALIAACAPFPLDIRIAAQIGRAMRQDGYIQRDPPDWALPIAAMAGAITRLHRAGLPPVLAFHYDEFWLIFARMHAVIASVLGPDCAMLPRLWAWLIDPTEDGRGWSPHRDQGRDALFADGTPKSLTVWLPLTDATPLNGCMYVVPANRDPTYNTDAEQSLQFQWPDIRALPARAGSILAWTQGLLHWGARTGQPVGQPPTPPRISIAAEFQRADVAPFEAPLLDISRPPDFAVRHATIGRLMLRYRHMHPLSPALEALANAMADGTLLAAGRRDQAREPVELLDR